MHDLIVVGGGVVGATAAYLGAREGLRTLLVDRRDPGRATDAGAGIVSPRTSTRHETLFDLGLRSAEFYPTLLGYLDEDGGGETGWAICGDLRVAIDADELGPFNELIALLDRRRALHGRPTQQEVSEISPEEAQRIFPPLARPLRAVLDRTAGRVDGRLLNQALLKAGARRKLEVASASVDRLLIEGGRVAGVEAGGTTYRAGHVVVSGGAWTPAIASQVGLAISVAPQRGQIVHMQLAGQPTERWPVIHGFRDYYIVTWRDGRVVAGATRETGSGFDPRVTAGGEHEVLGEALRVAPGLAGATLLETRVGLRPVSGDGVPILGALPRVTGGYVATGHGPGGLTLGPYSARVVVDQVLGRKPDLDLSPYRPDRF